MKSILTKNLKKIVTMFFKNILHLTITFAIAISVFAFHQNIFAQEGSNQEQNPDTSEELTGLELGPSGQLPTFIQFFNSLMFEDAENNPRSMSEIIQSDGAVLKSKMVFCDGTFKEVADCNGLGGSGSDGTPTIDTFSDSCTQCNRTTDLGEYDFCALSRLAGPGGMDTNCHVYKDVDGIWKLDLKDQNAGGTHTCEAICANGLGGGGSASGNLTCPAGFTKIESGGNTLGCISTDRRKEADYPDALNECFVNYGARLPSYNEAYIALSNYDLDNEPLANNYELVDEVFYDYYYTTAASGTLTHSGITFNNNYSDFVPSHRYSISSGSSALPAEAYHRCFIPAGNGGSSESSGISGVKMEGGYFTPNSPAINIGSEWDYISFNGIFTNSDSSGAGGYIYRDNTRNNKYYGVFFVGNGGYNEFEVNENFQCGYQNNNLGVCAQLSGSDLLISTKASTRVTYAMIDFGSGGGGSSDTDWVESSGNVYRENGYVGIGITNPNALLHIKSATASNAEIDIQSGNANHWAIYHDESSEELRFWNDDVPNDKHALKLDNDGDVHVQSLCLDGDCKSDWDDVGGGSITISTIDTFDETCNKCNKNIILGNYSFCALSRQTGFMSASGSCEVHKNGNQWEFRLKDGFSTNLECSATCFQ